MRNWKHYEILCLLALIVLAFIACDNDNGNNDKHTYSFGNNYVNNETQHWHICSCGEKSEIGNHSFNDGICTMCGYERAEFRSEDITVEFQIYRGSTPTSEYKTCNATVEATLIRIEMNNIKNKLTTAINGAYNSSNAPGFKPRFTNVFGQSSDNKVLITIENNVNYILSLSNLSF